MAVRHLKVILLLLMLSSAAAGRVSAISPFEADSQINTKAPDFTLNDMSGRPVSLSSLKGRVVLLNFWATWCPPCKAEMPSMNRIYNILKGRGLEVVAISSDSSISGIKDFLAKNRVDFRVLHDEKKAVTMQFRVFSMPTTFLIDRNGIIIEKFYGEYDWTETEVRKKIEKLL